MPERMLPPPEDDDEETEVSRRKVAAERRREESEEMTRRSWYASKESVNLFQATVDDLHFETRLPKHIVVGALLEAAVQSLPRVQRRLARLQGRPHK
ncbi:hypothetical protein [Streptomyces daliensis]